MTMVIRLGSAFGVVLFGAVFTVFVPEKNPVTQNVPVTRITEGFFYTFLFGLLVSIIILSVMAFIPSFKNKNNK